MRGPHGWNNTGNKTSYQQDGANKNERSRIVRAYTCEAGRNEPRARQRGGHTNDETSRYQYPRFP